MAIELITGRAGKVHIGSEDDRAYHAYTNGEGRYILNGGTANIESANNVHIDPVEFLVDGAHVRVTGAGEDVVIENGAASYKRIDVIALHYIRTGNEDNYIESVEFAVVKGANVELGSEPQAPDMPKSGTILTGADDVYVPVYSLLIDGLTPKNLTTLLEKYALSVTHGGTGATSATSALNNLGIKKWLLDNVFKVGYVWVSYTNTSPSGIVGGTWAPITGRFPYFNAGTGTGGANSLALSMKQMPRHIHVTEAMKNASYWLGYNSYGDTTQAAGVAYSQITNQYSIKVSSKISTNVLNQYMGEGSAFNNMPAYQELYAWRRTA